MCVCICTTTPFLSRYYGFSSSFFFLISLVIQELFMSSSAFIFRAMGALLVSLRATFVTDSVQSKHPLNLPLPPVLHKVLDKDFIKKFDEILVIGDVHGCYDELIELLE